MTRLSVLIGTGSALPRRALGNAELAKMLGADANYEYIYKVYKRIYFGFFHDLSLVLVFQK